MFSLEKFYPILYDNLLYLANIKSYFYFYPFGSTSPNNFSIYGKRADNYYCNKVLFFDQEPLLELTIKEWALDPSYNVNCFLYVNNKNSIIFANSEISEFKDNFCKEYGFYDWYYFFHGFAALDWYRDFKYLKPNFEFNFTKVFISLNNIITKYRSYRITLMSKFIENDLLKNSIVSFSPEFGRKTIKDEIFDPYSLLSKSAKQLITKNIKKLSLKYTVDHFNIHGEFSAKLDIKLQQHALWNVVTETIFYHDKLHLTEKIFKPIVSCQPFILVGAVNNLQYLKSYGFKTFDRWIDESYDSEKDPDKRIDMILIQLNKLNSLSMSELKRMQIEMREVLEHNFYHFYGDFKKIIISEMVDNFHNCVCIASNGQWGEERCIRDKIDYDAVKKLLMS